MRGLYDGLAWFPGDPVSICTRVEVRWGSFVRWRLVYTTKHFAVVALKIYVTFYLAFWASFINFFQESKRVNREVIRKFIQRLQLFNTHSYFTHVTDSFLGIVLDNLHLSLLKDHSDTFPHRYEYFARLNHMKFWILVQRRIILIVACEFSYWRLVDWFHRHFTKVKNLNPSATDLGADIGPRCLIR